MTVNLYREPEPNIVIVVPNGYRGLLKIDMRPVPQWVQGGIGQRTFRFHATLTGGYVEVPATPLLLRAQIRVLV